MHYHKKQLSSILPSSRTSFGGDFDVTASKDYSRSGADIKRSRYSGNWDGVGEGDITKPHCFGIFIEGRAQSQRERSTS